ncbi:hypothetical protein [Woodsholea maritima]|uniref:hypothetical protein n=1 Tax=Woodsholea maritima TaxID=240237 RepID=UPI00036E1834|nr:hypothetical protein [Woodsholea maritima]
MQAYLSYQSVGRNNIALMHVIMGARSNDQRVQTIAYEYPDQSLSPYFNLSRTDTRATEDNQRLAIYMPCLRYGSDEVRQTLTCLPGFDISDVQGFQED